MMVHSPETFNIVSYILGSNVINFVIEIAIIIWLLKLANISGIISNIRNKTVEAIQNAEKEKQNRIEQLAKVQKRVENSDQESQKIIEEAKEVANKLSESIMTGAGKQSEHIINQAHAEAETQKQSITTEVASKITAAAFVIAKEHINKAIDQRMHKKYIDEFIDSLDKA